MMLPAVGSTAEEELVTDANEIQAEQAYFDEVAEARERMRSATAASPEAAAHPGRSRGPSKAS